ncbi:MAG TPA: polysaccharide biosynthesis/export family protein [Ohtaekwangia sp.]
MRFLLLFAGAVLLLSSCVTNKKFVYLQKDDVNPKKNELPKDSIVRDYAVQPFDYKIQTNDILSVRFESLTAEEFDFLSRDDQRNVGGTGLGQGNAQLIGDLVDNHGEIRFPFIGKFKVSGLTVFEIQEKLQAVADQYLESPVVKVNLINYRITILGEVNKEGNITLGNNRVSMLEAIGLAGGLTDLADKANVKLIRQIDGKAEIVYLNLLDENFIHSPYYYVHQNDVLIAGALKQRPYRKYFGQNLALIISSLSLLLLTISLSK